MGTNEHNYTATAMKIIILSVLVGFALARPQDFEQNPNGAFAVIRSESNGPVEADFSWLFETENGISANANGVAGSNGQSNHDGAFSFTHDDGTLTEVQYRQRVRLPTCWSYPTCCSSAGNCRGTAGSRNPVRPTRIQDQLILNTRNHVSLKK